MNPLMRAPQIFPALLLACLFILADQSAYPFSWSQTELHHIFPREHTDWFNMKGINPDLWCIPLSREKHTGAGSSVHHHKYRASGGRNYNDSWVYFIKTNPEASEAECFIFAAMLFSEVGINLNKMKFYNYRTGVLSKVKMPKGRLLDRIWPIVGRLSRMAGAAAQYAGVAVMAYEMFDLVTDTEIPMSMEKYVSGLEAYFNARELYDAGKYRESRMESMKYCYEMGSLAYEFFKFSQKFSLDPHDLLKMSMNSFRTEEAKNIALEYLVKANSIRASIGYIFPEIPYELGQMYRFNRKKDQARTCLMEAEKEFQMKGDREMADNARKLLDEIR